MKVFYNETYPAELGCNYISEPDHVFHMEGLDTMPGKRKVIEPYHCDAMMDVFKNFQIFI